MRDHHHHHHLLLLASLLFLWGCGLPMAEGAAVKASRRAGCDYHGKLYVAGSRFQPEPCINCHCPRRGGVAKCTVKDCMVERHCVSYSNGTNQCCPKCEEYGCRHTDGKLFQQGEVIRHEPCVRCYCPVGGGDPVCDVTDCPLSQCVDPVKVEGVCCPVCPNGPNCQIGLLTLPIGQSVVIEGATCTCESFTDVDGEKRTLARCNKY
ncbi:brorin [Aplysia californica]|uniref:Brorin n=1 Tax=Aplysia californica TaxID=6500 RepID=A0ABM0JK93_APLCA|nr:brorin [Aplysia californica]